MEHIEKEKALYLLKLIYKVVKKNWILVIRVANISNFLSLNSLWADFTHMAGFRAKSLYQILSIFNFKNIQILIYDKIDK